MGIELELYMLIGLLTLGASIFAVFEVETPRWRKVLKWLILVGGRLDSTTPWGTWRLFPPLLWQCWDQRFTSSGVVSTGFILCMRRRDGSITNCAAGTGPSS